MVVRVLVRFPRLEARALLGVPVHIERKAGVALHVADGHILSIGVSPDGTQMATPVTDHSSPSIFTLRE